MTFESDSVLNNSFYFRLMCEIMVKKVFSNNVLVSVAFKRLHVNLRAMLTFAGNLPTVYAQSWQGEYL